jgi:hypothetical protein
MHSIQIQPMTIKLFYVFTRTKLPGYSFLLLFICLCLPVQQIKAQHEFGGFLDSAKANNAELVSLKAQRNYLLLESNMIRAVNAAPKVYLSSEYLFAPYLNNKGKPVSINPDDRAVGYDIGITNGGLYAFLVNLEYPVFNRGQVNNLIGQNKLEIIKIETRIKTLDLELEHSLANLYFDVLTMQAGLQNVQENLNLLAEQLKSVKTLTRHGLYKYLDYKLMETALKTDSIDYENTVTAFHLGIKQLKTFCGISDTSSNTLSDYKIIPEQDRHDSSLFLKAFQEDSLASIWQQKTFNNHYRPQIKVFANSGVNSTSIPFIERHVGMSAGVQFTYTLFDGRQKSINQQQQIILINEATLLKELKDTELKNQIEGYRKAIESTKASIEKETAINKEYDELLNLYIQELKTAQVSIIDYLGFLQKYNTRKLNLEIQSITLNKLMNEYNYWNQ